MLKFMLSLCLRCASIDKTVVFGGIGKRISKKGGNWFVAIYEDKNVEVIRSSKKSKTESVESYHSGKNTKWKK